MKVKLRGIYSTALTKVFLDEGFEITQAADAIKKALNLSEESEPDVIVEDLETKEGVYVYGSGPKKAISVLKKHFNKSIFYKEDIGRIYCGIIKATDPKSKSIMISLPDDEEGALDLKNFWGYVKPGQPILVQSKGTYDGRIMLSTQLRLFGENLIIIKNGFTKMSRGIRSHEGRDKLYDIAKSLDLKDWGVLWVQGAENREESVLRSELSSLMQKEGEISERFAECKEPKVLYEGVDKYFTIFGKEDKNRLDEIRKEVMPTIMNHHSLKSAGYTILTDLAENLLDKTSDRDMSDRINATLLRYGPSKGKVYRLAFTRLNGTSYRVDGILDDVTVEDGRIKNIRVVNRNDWGEKSYVLSEDTDYVEVKRGDNEERILILRPEIFPKFAKVTTLDVSVKKENGTVTANNEDRIDKLFRKEEIQEELRNKLQRTLEEMKRL